MTELDTFEQLKYKIIVDGNGTKWYYNSLNQLHREGGPAIIYTDGDQFWYINGKCHREDGPAVTYAKGHREWWVNGKFIK